MAARTVSSVEIWTDVEANSGSRLSVIPDWISAEETYEIASGKEGLLLELRRQSAAWSDIEHRRIIRVVLSDDTVSEWRIGNIDDAIDEGGGLTARIPCESIRYDLGSRVIERVEADGRAHGVFTLLSLTPDEHVDFLLGFAPAWFTKGTIDPTAEIDLQYENDSPLSALSELAKLAEVEIEVERNGATDFLVHLRTAVGSSATKVYFRYGKNARGVQRRSKNERLANRVFPVGATLDGVQSTMGEATWEVTNVAGSVVTLAGSPIAFDDQLNSAYLEKTNGTLTAVSDSDSSASTVTVADPSSISVGHEIRFRRNASGDELTYLEDPSSVTTYGQVDRVVRRTDIPLIENLVANAFISDWTAGNPDNWSDVGTPSSVTENTDELYTRFGGSSAHVVAAADGDGIISDAITIAPSAARPFFSAQVSLFIVSGSIQFRLIDATNATEYPDDDSDLARSNKAGVWIDRLAIEGIDLNVVGSTSVQIEVKAIGGAAEFYVDAAQVEQMGASSPTFNGGRASVDLWNAANEYLTLYSEPAVEFDVDVIDLERIDPTGFPFDELVLGGDVGVVVDGLDLDFSTRVKSITRELGVPGVTNVVLSSSLEDLSGLLGTPGRRPREDLEKDLGTSAVATFKDFRAYVDGDGDLVVTYRLNAPHGLSVAYAYSNSSQPTRASVVDASHPNYGTNNASSASELTIASALAPDADDIAYITMVAYSGSAVAGFPGEMVQQAIRVSISANWIPDGTIIADKLTDQAKRFTTDIAFSATDNDTVEWTAGTIELADGNTYSISLGNTGAMSALTYIYFDKTVSTTTLNVTSVYGNAVGENVVLLCVAENVADAGQEAFFVPGVGVFGMNEGQLSPASVSSTVIQDDAVTTPKLIANAVTAAKISAGAVETGKLAASAVTTDKLAANSVTAAKINVVSLSAISADLGTVTAGTVSAAVIIASTSFTATTATFNGVRIQNELKVEDLVRFITSGAIQVEDGRQMSFESATSSRGSIYGSNSPAGMVATGDWFFTTGDVDIANDLIVDGKIWGKGELEIDGAFNHDGTTFGAFGVPPTTQRGPYLVTNVTTDRTYNANSTNVAELADVLGTLIADLRSLGFVS